MCYFFHIFKQLPFHSLFLHIFKQWPFHSCFDFYPCLTFGVRFWCLITLIIQPFILSLPSPRRVANWGPPSPSRRGASRCEPLKRMQKCYTTTIHTDVLLTFLSLSSLHFPPNEALSIHTHISLFPRLLSSSHLRALLQRPQEQISKEKVYRGHHGQDTNIPPHILGIDALALQVKVPRGQANRDEGRVCGELLGRSAVEDAAFQVQGEEVLEAIAVVEERGKGGVSG